MTGAELAVRTAEDTGPPDIREAGARVVLREARQRGHDYVDIRWAGRRVVFFCTLCLTQCFGDSSLWGHLRGAPHARRQAAAMRTLFGPLPWPFSDGVLFFSTTTTPTEANKKVDLVVPDAILVGEKKLAGLTLRISGIGHVAASVSGKSADKEEEKEDRSTRCRIWCAWLGEGGADDVPVLSTAPDCEFAVVNLKYSCELGRRSTTEELTLFLEDGGSPRKRLRKSFSDPEGEEEEEEEVEEEEDEESGGGGRGDSEGSSNGSISAKEGGRWDGMRLLSSKALRREVRRRERLAAERTCDMCRQRMLPGKDVAALLNLKTGRFACSSRNNHGAFHVFHISCLIHWILLCELEIWNNNKPAKRGGRGRKGKRAPKGHISSIFCPECQGTGANVQEELLEHPTVHLSEMFLYKLKAIQGHRSWMEDPEPLPKCCTGLNMSCDEQLKDKVLPSKLLHFYRADI